MGQHHISESALEFPESALHLALEALRLLVPAPRDLPKAAPVVVKSAPVKSVEFKPPECYRNSRNSSAAPLDAPIPDNPNDASPANGDQCVVM